MAGRGQFDKSERNSGHPVSHPSDLDQFGHEMGGGRIAPTEELPVRERDETC